MAYLIVEDGEAERMAAQIARATGQTIEAVVIEALREKLDRLPIKQERAASFDELLAIANRLAGGVDESKVVHGELLFDDHGLPK